MGLGFCGFFLKSLDRITIHLLTFMVKVINTCAFVSLRSIQLSQNIILDKILPEPK